MHKPVNLWLLGLLLILLGSEACGSAVHRSSGELFLHSMPERLPETPIIKPVKRPDDTRLPVQSQPTQPRTPGPSQSPSGLPTRISRPASFLIPTHEPTFTPFPNLPLEHILSNFRGHHQLLAIDCEAAAAVDWAKHFGVVIDEREFQLRLPHSDNPDYGFVGDVNSVWGKLPPHGYGVYAGPVADLINSYGIPAKAYKGYTLEQIKAKIAQDIPVMAWVTGNVASGVPVNFTDSLGRTFIAAAFEHVVIVTGYDAGHIRYISEGITQFTTSQAFLNSWGVLGNMVVVDR